MTSARNTRRSALVQVARTSASSAANTSVQNLELGCVQGGTIFDKRESDTIWQVALDMDGLTTKNIFRALIACYRAGYRHAEGDCNEASLELKRVQGHLDRGG
jgi:hypothetical protein